MLDLLRIKSGMLRTLQAPLLSRRYALAIVVMLGLLAGCSSAPKAPPMPRPRPRVSAPPPVIPYALGLQGTPYRWGGNTPAEGFDCSGFVRYVYGRYGVQLPRRAVEQAAWVPKVPLQDRRPGDLLFFDTGTHPVSHVGIYIGRDEFVHASSSRAGQVIVSDLRKTYWWEHLVAVGRPIAPRH